MSEINIDLPPLEERPLVTFALFAYNQEKYIREAVEGAFSQTYEPLEIVLSDDCSTDRTFEIIEEMAAGYRGPHDLVVRQNDTNQGLAVHINHVMSQVCGKLVVVAAGDDVSFPHRVAVVVQHWIEGGRESGSIFSRFQAIDTLGKITFNESLINKKKLTLADRDFGRTRAITVGTRGCAHAWTRNIFDLFGPIHERIIHEDITIPLRSLLLGSVTFLPEDLVLYRMVAGSQSRVSFSSHRERFQKMARYWEGRVANYEQYQVDVEKISGKDTTFIADVEWLSKAINHEANIAQANQLFFGGQYVDRFKVVLDFRKRISPLRRLKFLVLALIPPLYGIQIK